MSKTVLVPVAEGTEEIEAICIIDILRRANADVIVASVNNLQITASRGVKLVADCLIDACSGKTYDLIALPGGMPGAEHLRDSEILTRLLKAQHEGGRLFAAICAAPVVVLKHHGLIGVRKATSHPSFASQLENQEQVQSRVVVDGNCITSRGAGTAVEFALTLTAMLFDKETANTIAGALVAPPGCS